jgi:hypothetical protein
MYDVSCSVSSDNEGLMPLEHDAVSCGKLLSNVSEELSRYTPVFSNVYPWRNPQNNFAHPDEPLHMKTFTGKLITESAIKLLLNYSRKFIFKELVCV